MTEAEHCIALKRNVAMTKPVGHDSSAAEMYCPKRKCSDQSHEESPPPYIPSRKNSVDQSSMSGCISQQYEARVLGHNDVRHTLSREDCRELISRYRREELLRTIGIVRDSSYQLKSFRSHERGRRSQEGNKDFTSERKVKSDNSSAGVKNFQITTRVVPSGLRSVSDCHDSKEEQRSSSPEQSLQVTLSPVPNKDSRISITARLGKVVVERKEDFPEFENTGETIHSRVSYSQFSTEHKDSSEDVIPKGGQSKLKTSLTGNSGDGQVISSSGRAAVKRQHEADVISLQAARPSRKAKRHSIPDNRIVHNDVYTHSHVDGNVEENNESLGDIAAVAIKSGHLKEIPSAMVRAWDSSANQDEDLAQMIDRDPRPELQGDIHTGECTLHLDGGGTSHVVEGEKLEKGINRHEKVEKKFGTRFIVTLDGVDERQFSSEDSSVSDKLIRPAPIPTATVTASNLQQLKQKLLLDFPAVKNRPVSETLLQQVQTLRPTAVVPCKLTPPKIQPFSISLQDSDDEHHEERRASASKQDSSHLIKEVKEEDSEISALKRAKMSERCKFWPACAAGHSCEYRHPTTQCKTFPNCKFGDTCLFIHPKCRFDSNCTRPECPYAHTSHRSALAEAAHVIAIPPPHFVFSPAPHKPHFLGSSFPSSQTMCHYFPNCQNMNCPFLHPKQCRFGTACRNPACPFYHPPVRTSRRKWQAHHVQQRSQVATLLASVKMEHTFPRISSSAKQSHSTVSSTSQ